MPEYPLFCLTTTLFVGRYFLRSGAIVDRNSHKSVVKAVHSQLGKLGLIAAEMYMSHLSHQAGHISEVTATFRKKSAAHR